jgi:16S rRNA (cytosine1402-N4)-methyltransferase
MMHQPVMVQRIIDLLRHCPKPHHILDATFGRGGHSKALLDALPTCTINAIDRDPEAVAYAHTAMTEYGDRFSIAHTRFSLAESMFEPGTFSAVLLDVGVSSPQLDNGQRGFSIQKPGPLDMRMNPLGGQSAADIVNSMPEKELANIIFTYGEERNSRRIAKYIVETRRKENIETTEQLAAIVLRATPHRSKIHPATKTFQALRIVVNNELDELRTFLSTAHTLVKPGGMLCTLCFHSLEDRIAKHFFKQSHHFSCPDKKPTMTERSERLVNPRARSARLRFGIKNNE